MGDRELNRSQDSDGAARLIVETRSSGKPVARTLHGIFIEDINHASDGGLYAELVRNRSFDDPQPLFGWTPIEGPRSVGRVEVVEEPRPGGGVHRYVRIRDEGTKAEFGLVNSGFDGIVVRGKAQYLFRAKARAAARPGAALSVALVDPTGQSMAEGEIPGIGSDWQLVELTLTCDRSDENARLVLRFLGPGILDLDFVSLFPEQTFRGHRNGLRTDLAQALVDLAPGSVRFPGGCVVEGVDPAGAYRWKETIGPVIDRKPTWNLWQAAQNWNPWRPAQKESYYPTNGLGFFEYFQLAEDLGAEPVPVINCGMCCQMRDGPLVPLADLAPFVQDALDLVEFANGPATSEWGGRRAALGHPEPFHLKFISIGNEQWLQEYFDRYALFCRALKSRYPDLQIIGSTGWRVNDRFWTFAWDRFRSGTPVDIVDEHFFVRPHWFSEHADRYAAYDPNGPKIFVGEFSAMDGKACANTLRAALSEAAFLTGVWRNSDKVVMTSYAPLFAKIGHEQWTPNLLWFDNHSVLRTPSYHVQALFSRNRPDTSLPVETDPGGEYLPFGGRVGVGTSRGQAEFQDLVVTDAHGRVLLKDALADGLKNWSISDGRWSLTDRLLRQSSEEGQVHAVVGDPAWTDYSLSLRARKVSGKEGFLILFETPSVDRPTWWRLGAEENTHHALEGDGLSGISAPGSIETGRWYDVRIDVRGTEVTATLDGQVVHHVDRRRVPVFHAAAGRDNRQHELILQLVNLGARPLEVDVDLQGAALSASPARVTVLSADDPSATNTLENPTRIEPRESTIANLSARFRHRLTPYSHTVLRIPEKRG